MKLLIKSSVLSIFTTLIMACSPSSNSTSDNPGDSAAPQNQEQKSSDKDIVDIAVGDSRFSTLVAAVSAAGLVDTLKSEGPFTVLAPTNDAFAKLPAGTIEFLLEPANKQALTNILLYHVLALKADSGIVKSLVNQAATTVLGKDIKLTQAGSDLFINDSKVIITDIQAKNGIIHVIDTVLIPEAASAPKKLDIVDTAIAAGSFKTLVAAVSAAGLVETLRGEVPFTVFAPTDEAFAKLGKTVDELLLPENKETLTQILLYHVVAGKVLAKDAVLLSEAPSVSGAKLALKVESGSLFINQSKVIAADIETSNGVIHVIDAVLIP
ncbi:MAG: fasciclin domain-containing protein [Pseudobdellovibrionaceae bacterium]